MVSLGILGGRGCVLECDFCVCLWCWFWIFFFLLYNGGLWVFVLNDGYDDGVVFWFGVF